MAHLGRTGHHRDHPLALPHSTTGTARTSRHSTSCRIQRLTHAHRHRSRRHQIEAIALDDDGGTLLRQSDPVATRRLRRDTLEAVVRLVRTIEKDLADVGTIGVGIPGTISPASGLVKNANSTWLIGRPLAEDLTTRIGRPIRFANDANCFAVSEATDAVPAPGRRSSFGVIARHWNRWRYRRMRPADSGTQRHRRGMGHNPLPWPGPDEWPGPPCYCGRSGCIRDISRSRARASYREPRRREM